MLFTITFTFQILLSITSMGNSYLVLDQIRSRKIPQSGARQALCIYVYTEKAPRNMCTNRCSMLLLDAHLLVIKTNKQETPSTFLHSFIPTVSLGTQRAVKDRKPI